MQTTSTNESMFSDFFQVGGYSNLAGASAGLVRGRGGKSNGNQKFSDLASKGRTKGFLGIIHKKFTRIYDEIKQDFELSDFRINQLYGEHKSQGGNLNDFKDYVSQAEESKVKEQIINEENTLPNMDSIDVSDVDFTEKKIGSSYALCWFRCSRISWYNNINSKEILIRHNEIKISKSKV